MGFSSTGAALLNKVGVPKLSNPGAAFWTGKKITLELQAFCHIIWTQLDVNYAMAVAKHHHENVPLDTDTVHVIAEKFVYIVTKKCNGWSVFFPNQTGKPQGVGAPTSIEFVLEHEYEPKTFCTLQRRNDSAAAFAKKEWKKSAVFPDCIMKEALRQLKTLGCILTLPPAEADGTLSRRARSGNWVFVCSKDSDIPMQNLGSEEWNIFMPGANNSELLRFTQNHKKCIYLNLRVTI